MSEAARMWMEIGFNIAYLVAIYILVWMMWRERQHVPPAARPLLGLFTFAFALLALGDTGHVGFRVLAYARGGLASTIGVGSSDVGLVGLGALATAITVTFFYAIMLFIWRARYRRELGWFGWLLLGAALVRLGLMFSPANEWNNVVPPAEWSLYRNLPLMVQGLGVAALILRDARSADDRAFFWVGLLILISYTFYTPVILFVRQYPLIGMLMIPKTLAYVGIALVAYRHRRRLQPIPLPRPLPAA